MHTPNPRVLMIEALIDGELNPPEKANAETEIENSIELRLLYDILKNQKQAIKNAFLTIGQAH